VNFFLSSRCFNISKRNSGKVKTFSDAPGFVNKVAKFHKGFCASEGFYRRRV